MDRKEVIAVVKLELCGGCATPAPPAGPALGQHGVAIGEFLKQFNYQTREQSGNILPVVVTIYKDKSFSFVVKTPKTTCLLKEAAGIAKGSGQPNTEKAGFITRAQLERIAEVKLPDLNTSNIEQAMKMIEGTARSMGIEIRE